jgi:signal transduction histidine kinase
MSSANRTPVIKTLRGRLTVWHLGVLTVSLGVFAALSYAVLSWNLYRHHDDELAHQADELGRVLNEVSLNQTDIRQALLGAPVGTRFVMVRDGQGELLYRDPVLESGEPGIGQQEMLVHAAAMSPQSPVFFTVDLERSSAVRFICVPLRQPSAYLQIGDPLGDVQSVLTQIAMACVPLLPVVLFLSSFGGWLIARRALAPMDVVTTTLKNIQATDLQRRVDVPAADEELHALVATLNQLLDRLQQAFDSLRQFAGDVSHQIQTPLTVIKGALDAAGREPDRARQPDWLGTIHDEVDGIRDIVVNLRALALADAPIVDRTQVNLSHIVEEASDIIAALGELRGVTVHTTVEAGIIVAGDATRLKQVVLNLGDNAVKYTPAGGRVTIRLSATTGQGVLRVADTGIGIGEEHLPLLFDRLFRTESAGQRAEGTGLGLAIAKRILDAHGGTISVQSAPGTGSAFTVRLPRSK